MLLKLLAILLLLFSGLFVFFTQMESPRAEDPGLSASHWESPAATNGIPPHDWSALEKNLKPESCAQCHSEQFADWSKSLHAHAYSPGLIGQFPGMGHAAGNDCLKCHAPLAEQAYLSDRDMLESLKKKLKEPVGFSKDGDPDGSSLPLRHAGVTCAACHVREWQRFGPPQRGSGKVGRVKGPAHNGFTATKDFERSNFCASCHQFPQEYAINGKPLENTVTEWQQSRFAREGVECQSCHMPDRRHAFKGIHDPEMTRKGLDFELERSGEGASLTIHSRRIGHAFPTYVTPKVVVEAEALNRDGNALNRWQWEIIREVYYDSAEGGWKERRDSRLMPGERRVFEVSALPEGSVKIRYRIRVIPDYFYKGVYQSLLSGELVPDAKKLIDRASAHADANDYLLYEGEVVL